jgi:hypothetical protein
MKPDAAPEHSRLSPSKAHTWTECTAALQFVKDNEHRLPPDKAGPSAIEGTKAHTVAEYLLLGKPAPKWATKDMLRHGKAYAEFCHEVKGPTRDVLQWGAEYRAPLYYLPSERGTVDFHAITKTGIHLVDYKYGYDPVSSVENKQMAIYARSLIEVLFDGFWHPLLPGDRVITMTIFQPRIDGEPCTWTTTWRDLLAFTDLLITPKAASILRGDPGVFKCGPKICKWCRGAAICDAYNDSLLNDFRDEVEAVLEHKDLPPAAAISDERIVQIFTQQEKLTTYLKEINKFVLGRQLSANKLPGVKLVMSRGAHRKWLDAEAAGKLLLGMGLPYDDVFPPPDVITPAVAEKLTKGMKGPQMIELQRLIVKPPGSPMAVPESDPRKGVELDPADDFAGIDLNEE